MTIDGFGNNAVFVELWPEECAVPNSAPCEAEDPLFFTRKTEFLQFDTLFNETRCNRTLTLVGAP